MLKSHYYEGLVEAGCDEAGRGCLAGSVYAAAVILPENYENDMLNDSKKLSVFGSNCAPKKNNAVNTAANKTINDTKLIFLLLSGYNSLFIFNNYKREFLPSYNFYQFLI